MSFEMASSIRAQLLRWLLGPTLLLLAIGGLMDYGLASRPASSAYDGAVLKTAYTLADLIEIKNATPHLRLPAIAERVLRSDKYDRIYFLVTGTNLLVGDVDLPQPPRLTVEPVLYDAVYRGNDVRAAAMQVVRNGQSIVIIAAETMVKRQRMVWELLMGMLVPEVVVAAALVAFVWFAIRKGLQPLHRLRQELLQRDTNDLQTLDPLRYPVEVRPVLHGLNQVLQRLSETLQSQQRFIADAAHQLRTPLSGLQTLADLALRQPDLQTTRGALTRLQEATERLVHLTNQLLVLARADPDYRSHDEFTDVNVEDVVTAGVDLWVAPAVAKNIDLGFDLQRAEVYGSSVLLQELLSNLIYNSIAYTPAGGRVTVRTGMQGDTAWLSVEDDGPGIPAELRQRVMERFYRIEGVAGEGCGLGLAIVANIVKAHAGEVAIESTSADHGTRVRVQFPARWTWDSTVTRSITDRKGASHSHLSPTRAN